MLKALQCFTLMLGTSALPGVTADFDHILKLDTSGGGTLYVEAVIGNNLHQPFLVDTGSAMLTINSQTLKQLQQRGEIKASGRIGARLANGKIHNLTLYKVDKFSIGEHCQLGEVEVAVIPNGKNILGLNLLSKAAPFAMHVNPPRLALSNCSGDAEHGSQIAQLSLKR